MIPSQSNFLFINSFPRSGKEFFKSCFLRYEAVFTFVSKDDDQEYIDPFLQFESLSCPHIIENPKLKNIVIFRNPYDAIASLVFTRAENQGMLNTFTDNDLQFYVNMYLEFTKAVEKALKLKNVIVIDFDKMIKNPAKTCEAVMDIVRMENVNNKKFTDKELTEITLAQFVEHKQMDMFKGLMPRSKTVMRNTVNAKIKGQKDFIEPAMVAYNKILKHCI